MLRRLTAATFDRVPVVPLNFHAYEVQANRPFQGRRSPRQNIHHAPTPRHRRSRVRTRRRTTPTSRPDNPGPAGQQRPGPAQRAPPCGAGPSGSRPHPATDRDLHARLWFVAGSDWRVIMLGWRRTHTRNAVTTPGAPITTAASFMTEAGRPGLKLAGHPGPMTTSWHRTSRNEASRRSGNGYSRTRISPPHSTPACSTTALQNSTGGQYSCERT